MTRMFPEQVLVVGLGLIGASFIKALKCRGVNSRFLGSTRSETTLKAALESGLVEEGSNDLADISKMLNVGDVVLVATPTLSVPKIIEQLKKALQRGVIVTDAASVKGSVLEAVSDIFGDIPPNFIMGHPIAGSEKSGLFAADENLYQGQGVILTPLASSDQASLMSVRNLWERAGALVSEMSVETHDQILAATSHLPHVLAYSLVNTLAGNTEYKGVFEYAAGGFRDFTRIAASDPVMWHDIVLANKSAILKQMDEFTSGLALLRQAINDGDNDAILEIFSRAKKVRDDFSVILAGREKK